MVGRPVGLVDYVVLVSDVVATGGFVELPKILLLGGSVLGCDPNPANPVVGDLFSVDEAG